MPRTYLRRSAGLRANQSKSRWSQYSTTLPPNSTRDGTRPSWTPRQPKGIFAAKYLRKKSIPLAWTALSSSKSTQLARRPVSVRCLRILRPCTQPVSCPGASQSSVWPSSMATMTSLLLSDRRISVRRSMLACPRLVTSSADQLAS